MENFLPKIKRIVSAHKRILLIGGGILLVALLVHSRLTTSVITEEQVKKTTSVAVASVASLNQASELQLLGTVAPAEKAYITSEINGRIQTIQAKEGDVVSIGSILASVNNTEQRIAVTQAQTSLQAARASAAQSDIGVEEANAKYDQARQALENTVQSSFTTAQRVMQENIDPHYSNPRSGAIGVRVGKGVMVQTLNSKRVSLRETMPSWEAKTNSLSALDETELLSIVTTSQQNIGEIISLVEDFIYVFQNEDSNSAYTAETLQNLYITFTRRKEELLTLQNTISTSQTNLTNAKNALAKAEIANSTESYDGGNTQVKQAEAALASAQNRLEQTIFRAPISGTIQDFSITLGEYVTPGTRLATIANETAQEITTYISNAERDRLHLGDQVLLDNTYEGTVTNIAPSIDSQSGKLAVKIITSDTDLTSGSTVEVTITTNTVKPENEITAIYIPLTAILFDTSGSNVLTVSDDNILQSVPVSLGETQGSSVEVLSGIDSQTEIVIDARGKKSGEAVTIQSE